MKHLNENFAHHLLTFTISPFPSCCEPHSECEAECKAFQLAVSLSFIMRFIATRKWPIKALLLILTHVLPFQLIPSNQIQTDIVVFSSLG